VFRFECFRAVSASECIRVPQRRLCEPQRLCVTKDESYFLRSAQSGVRGADSPAPVAILLI